VTRVLAVDWGSRRVGLAVGDATARLARSLPTLSVTGLKDAVRQVDAAARAEDAGLILIGLPLHDSGDESPSSAAARRLGGALAARGHRIAYHDERLTSDRARDLLAERGETRPAPGRVDAVAAALLLQEYLDAAPPAA